MPWNEAAAQEATRKAHPQLVSWRADHPEACEALVKIWKEHYLVCGHKRLAQMLVMGRTPEQTDGKGG